MRVIFIILCSLCSWLAFAADNLNVTVSAEANQFSISLPANPTTGYHWVVNTYDKHYLNTPTEQYVASAPARIGSGGNTVFTFEKKAGLHYPKNTKMTFSYQRPWDPSHGHLKCVTITFKNNPVVQDKK